MIPALDPLQFTYRPGIGVEDAIIYLLHRSLSHLEQVGNTVRVMFFDFSSAFNTIQPAWLRGKLEGAGVDEQLTACTIDYLTNRPQYLRLHDCVSEVVVSSWGRHRAQSFHPSCLACKPHTSGTSWTTAISRSSQMIRPSSDAYQMGTARNTAKRHSDTGLLQVHGCSLNRQTEAQILTSCTRGRAAPPAEETEDLCRSVRSLLCSCLLRRWLHQLG